ncbi:TetR/AcrR family transcriptional regulator [Gordonia sp. NPDC003376]
MHINGQDRQQQIVRGAAELFRKNGYQQVSLKDLAAEVGITAPALYKHFSGKGEILHSAIAWGLDEVLHAVAPSGRPVSFHESIVGLAESAIEHKNLWILIHRNLGNLDASAQEGVRRRLREIRLAIRGALAAEQPEAPAEDLDIRSRAVIACMTAPAGYPLKVSRTALTRNIVVAATRAGAVEPRIDKSSLGPVEVLSPFQPRASRREQILACAADLFAQHGYDAVAIADIGGAVGISGPSVYSHFATKTEILETLMRRAVGWIEFDRALVLATVSEPHDICVMWFHRYAQMATRHRALFVIYTDEIPNLTDTERRWVERSHHDYFSSWVNMVAEATGLKDSEAHVMTACALSVINELSGSAAPYPDGDLTALVANIALDLLSPQA